MNEPRTSGNYERNRGLPVGKFICDWVKDMARFIK